MHISGVYPRYFYEQSEVLTTSLGLALEYNGSKTDVSELPIQATNKLPPPKIGAEPLLLFRNSVIVSWAGPLLKRIFSLLRFQDRRGQFICCDLLAVHTLFTPFHSYLLRFAPIHILLHLSQSSYFIYFSPICSYTEFHNSLYNIFVKHTNSRFGGVFSQFHIVCDFMEVSVDLVYVMSAFPKFL